MPLISVILLFIAIGTSVNAQVFSNDRLSGEVAKMACQIRPEDRKGVAVLVPVVDRNELQDCIGRPLAEAVIRVLWEFQFVLIENEPLFDGISANGPRVDRKSVTEIGRKTGARSLLIGEVGYDHDRVHLTYRMVRVETMEIIGFASCSFPKRAFAGCFLLHDLSPPTWGALILLPEPRRLR